MICNVFLNMCIVGLTQVGPALYKVEVMNDQQQIREFECREILVEISEGVLLAPAPGRPPIPGSESWRETGNM